MPGPVTVRYHCPMSCRSIDQLEAEMIAIRDRMALADRQGQPTLVLEDQLLQVQGRIMDHKIEHTDCDPT
jgi:hypothetical protein